MFKNIKSCFITGTMFAGKSNELIKIIKYFESDIINEIYSIRVYKHKRDNRWDDLTNIYTHDGKLFPCKPINSFKQVLNEINGKKRKQLIFIDEIQFFDFKDSENLQLLVQKSEKIFFAGLTKDYKSRYFPIIPEIKANTDYEIKVKTKCMYENCNRFATRTCRNDEIKSNERFVVGGAEMYQARCYKH